MHPCCAQETLLYLRILRVRRSLNSVQIQTSQLLLVIKSIFLVLVLGFHVIGIDCGRCRVDCKRDFVCTLLSDLTPTACPTDSMLWTVNLLHTQLSSQFRFQILWPPVILFWIQCLSPILFFQLLSGILWQPVVLNPTSIPHSVVPTFVPNSLTTRHLVRNLSLNVVTVRHLVLNRIFTQIVPIVVPIFCHLHLVHFAVSRHQLAHRQPTYHWNAASVRGIGLFLSNLRRWQPSCRLFPCRVSPHICAPVAGPPVCVSPVVSVIPTPVHPFCVILTGLCILRVVVHHFVNCVLSFLPVVFSLSFVLVLAFVLARLGFALARARLSTCLVVLQVLSFLSTVSLHVPVNSAPWNSVGGTFDLGCPSPTNPPAQPASLFVLTQRFPSLSQISSTLSHQQCWSPSDLEDHLSLNLGWQLRSNLAMLLSRHVPRMWLVFQNLSKNPWDHHWTWLRANAQVSKPSWLLKLVRVVGREVDTLVAPPALPTWARTAVLVLPSTWSTRDTAQWKCCEPIQDQITVWRAPSQWWLLNRHGVLHHVCRCLPAHHQTIVQTNCETLEPILATCHPHLRTAEADTSTQTRRSPVPVAVELLHCSPFFSLQLTIVQAPAVSPELVAQLPLLGLRRFCTLSLTLVLPAKICCVSAILPLLQHFPRWPRHVNVVCTTRPHNANPSTEAPQPLMSFYNTSAVDRMTCLFQAHGLNEHSLCTNVHQVWIVQKTV